MTARGIITPRLLKSAGDVTSAVGKWGQLPGEPETAGFDDYLRFKGSGVYWNDKDDKPEQYAVNGRAQKIGDKEYLPDLLHQQVIHFIKQHRAEPFYIYYSLSQVHGQLQPTPDSAAKSTGRHAKKGQKKKTEK